MGNIATAYVQIKPSMKGFRKTIGSEMGSAGKEGGSILSNSLSAAGLKAGKTMGKSLSTGMSASTDALGGGLLGKFQAQVDSARAAASKASRIAADDAGKVRAAEEKLNDVRAKGNASRSQIVAAEEKLAAAQRKAAESETLAASKAKALANAEELLAKATKDAAAAADDSGGRFGRFGAALDTVKGKVSGGMKTALIGLGKAAVAGTAAAGAAFVKIGKDAVGAYAEFEQLEGGVQKLFGGGEVTAATETVMANASQAFRTAGMSANQYMDTVTGFSASLISSLGGDTEKAASIADMAVRDMSDNANTFGTDMESIQNAYQGFAKGQYNMLDNLKLGYGGTKEEMQRLLDDASKISGIEYNIDSFADVTEAIHVMQESMNIAGTTAREASSTIEGSLNSMKGAWANVLTSLGSGEGIEQNVGALVDSVGTFLGNLIPVAKRVAVGIFTAIGATLKKKFPGLAPVFDKLGEMFTKVKDTVSKIDFGKIFNILKSAVSGVMPVIQNLVSIFTSVARVVGNVLNVIRPLASFLLGALVGAFRTVFSVISTVVGVVAKVAAAFASMNARVTGAINAVVAAVQGFAARVRGVFAGAAGWLVSAGANMIAGLRNGISNAIGTVTGVLSGIAGRIRGALAGAGSWLTSTGRSIIEGLISGIRAKIGSVASTITGGLSGAVSKVRGFFEINSPSKLMAREVGAPIAEGVAYGVEREAPDMMNRIEAALGGVENLSYTVPTYGATNTPNLSAAGVAAGGGRVVNQTINVQAIDPAAVASVIAARERVALGA